jgi:DNA-binding GntR family transcriptional regulator
MTSAADPRRETRGVSVTDELRRLIRTGEIPPGTRLVQAELANRFGTSITPIREALAALSRVGLVRHEMRRSPVVVRPTIEDMRNNLEVRLQLEPFAARRAAEHVDNRDIERLEAIAQQPNPTGDIFVHHEIDREFHAAINELSGNATLAEIIATLRDAAHVFSQFDGPRPTLRHIEQIAREHRAIVEALRHGDPASAEREVRRHLRAVARRAVAAF